VNIRNPWGSFEWDGDWSDRSPLWTPQMINEVKPVLDEKDGTFWMSFDDFIQHFSGLNVCRARNWQEHRIRGKFLRVRDQEDPSQETVLSKWYYELEVEEPTNIYIGVHQEDERI
jgi:calpain-15